jgi:hypothetical protein
VHINNSILTFNLAGMMTSELDSATTRQPVFTSRERGARSMMERQLSDHDRNHLHIKLFSRYRPTSSSSF